MKYFLRRGVLSVGWFCLVVNARTLSTATLLRHGIAPNWELRVSSDGLLHERSATGRRSGVGDLVVGFKRHCSAEQRGRPAMGLIAQVKLPTGDRRSATARRKRSHRSTSTKRCPATSNSNGTSARVGWRKRAAGISFRATCCGFSARG